MYFKLYPHHPPHHAPLVSSLLRVFTMELRLSIYQIMATYFVTM